MSKYSEETKAAAYVYGIRCRDSENYFYVGCTKHAPQMRFENHIYDALSGHHYNNYFTNKVKKYGAENIVFDTLEVVPRGKHFEAEEGWIKRLLEEGHQLVNRMHNDIDYRHIVSVRRGELPDSPPKMYHPIPELQNLLQDLICSEYETIAVLKDYLKGTPYEQ